LEPWTIFMGAIIVMFDKSGRQVPIYEISFDVHGSAAYIRPQEKRNGKFRL